MRCCKFHSSVSPRSSNPLVVRRRCRHRMALPDRSVLSLQSGTYNMWLKVMPCSKNSDTISSVKVCFIDSPLAMPARHPPRGPSAFVVATDFNVPTLLRFMT
ncbi:hypothetical protein HGRIS_013452 [Hohenbuehelia grisea]|uniref:Uncharacterized protein n=1 Tax=Hohenbuehelia grisea TaxID=104357 RepID=A0ABR3IVL0_9AGAR